MTKIFLILVCLVGMGVLFFLRRQAARVQNPTIASNVMKGPLVFWVGNAVLTLAILVSLWNTSIVDPGGNQFAVYDRVYACSSIKDGRNVALSGECGRQAEITMPGFHIVPLVGVLNNVEYKEMTDVPAGHYAVLSARDGVRLEDGQVAARPWPIGVGTFTNSDGKKVTGNMLDATFFLSEGKGQKGPQTTILPPGRYSINPYLWDVKIDSPTSKDGKTSDALTTNFVRTTIKTGHVGVVKSAIDDVITPAFWIKPGDAVNCHLARPTPSNTDQQIDAFLVPVGCRGVWKEALPPGEYFINKEIYQIEEHDTRLQNLVLAGGYSRRSVDLKIEDSGTIHQEMSKPEDVPQPQGAAGPAVAVKVEGWTVYQELRIQFRTKPEYAPLQAATIGQLKEVEDRMIIPQAISALRNIGGSNITVKNTTAYEEAKSELSALKARLEVLKDPNTDVGLSPEQRKQETAALERQVSGFSLPNPQESVTRPTRVLDFQNEREALEGLVAAAIQKIGQEAGVEIVSVTFGNADIPPELLVSRKVEQLSGQLRNAYTQMRTAQVQRQATEAAKARADKQNDLVKAQIDVETSKLGIEKRTNEGVAEQKYLEANAKGQQAMTEVLGADKVTLLRFADKFLDTLKEKPEIINAIRLPGTVVFGGGGLDGPAAILKGAFAGSEPTSAPIPRVPATAQR